MFLVSMVAAGFGGLVQTEKGNGNKLFGLVTVTAQIRRDHSRSLK